MTERPSRAADDAARSLRLAREVFSPSAAARERVWSGLAARAAGTMPASGSALPPAALPPAALPPAALPPARELAAAPRLPPPSAALAAAKSGLLVAAGFALGVWFSETRSAEQARAAVADAPPAPAAPAVDAPVLPVEQHELPPPPPAAAPVPSAAAPIQRAPVLPRARTSSGVATRSPAPASSAEELALLQRAERAIRAGDGVLARSFMAELDARTVWREEREAILVLAACVLAEPGAGRDARSFLRRHPGSVYFDRIGSVCRLGSDGRRQGGH